MWEVVGVGSGKTSVEKNCENSEVGSISINICLIEVWKEVSWLTFIYFL